MIDYRKILKVYMKAVTRAEGVSFVDNVPIDALTEEEKAALEQIDDEIEAEH